MFYVAASRHKSPRIFAPTSHAIAGKYGRAVRKVNPEEGVSGRERGAGGSSAGHAAPALSPCDSGLCQAVKIVELVIGCTFFSITRKKISVKSEVPQF
jgi:hypothetical protein